MSLLTPLYIAGLLAVSLPVLFHLIRRTPQSETPFSSLMFLSPSPPRITRRSRIEHWLLLVLRGLALALLALAFSRPFWRQTAMGDDAAAPQRRLVVLVDTSASMRRGDLWSQALRAVDASLAECHPQDEVAVYAFDEDVRPVASFADLDQVEPGQRAAVVQTRLKSIALTWSATHVGRALVEAVALLETPRDASEERGRAARRLVLVSDLQAGGRLAAVGDFPWPADVQLDLKGVAAQDPTNAGLERLVDETAEDAEAAGRKAALRIRVVNSADSTAEAFRLRWTGGSDAGAGAAIDAYVPAGESRVVRVPVPAAGLDSPRLLLVGDRHEFDNTLFVVPPRREQVKVLYLGADAATDPEGLAYYLERALDSSPARDVVLETLPPGGEITIDPQSPPGLVVVATEPTAAQAARLRDFAAGGGTVLYVLLAGDAGVGLRALTGLTIDDVAPAEVDQYAMLGEVDFAHPLFASMAGARFNDFTQIRFWRYRRVKLPAAAEVRVVAKFENGDPAIFEQRLGKGRVVAMTAGWQPGDGQLARSWKFLLMLSSLVDDSSAGRRLGGSYVVNQRVGLPDRSLLAENIEVTRPDGETIALAATAREFADTKQPGIYTLSMAAGPAQFAVNLDPMESHTAPLAPEAFEQMGCRLVGGGDAARESARLEQLRDVELESRQRWWQWLAAAALGVLVVETWLAGRLSRPATAAATNAEGGVLA